MNKTPTMFKFIVLTFLHAAFFMMNADNLTGRPGFRAPVRLSDDLLPDLLGLRVLCRLNDCFLFCHLKNLN